MSSILDQAKALLEKPKTGSKINSILNDEKVKEEIEKPREINRSYDVPYLAGSNKEGGTTYIDRRIPKSLKIKNKEIDPAKYLNVHEQTEHALMTIGKLPYKDAHAVATDKEKAAVTSDGVNWDEYEKVLDGYINETEHEKVQKAPPDLYLKPYPHTKQHFMQEKEDSTKSSDNIPVKDHHTIIRALIHHFEGNK